MPPHATDGRGDLRRATEEEGGVLFLKSRQADVRALVGLEGGFESSGKKRLQRPKEGDRVGPAVLPSLEQAAVDHRRELGGQTVGPRGQHGHGLVHLCDLVEPLAVERVPSGHEVVHHDADGPEIGSVIDDRSRGPLLGGEGGQGGGRGGPLGELVDRFASGDAGTRARHCARRTFVILKHSGNPEVEHLHHSVVTDEDVLGLQVAVDHPFAVGEGERSHHRNDELNRAGGREGLALSQKGGERAAHQVLGDKHRASFPPALGGVGQGDVLVGPAQHRPGFDEKLLGDLGRRVPEELDGDRLSSAGVAPKVDGAEAAPPDELDELVAAPLRRRLGLHELEPPERRERPEGAPLARGVLGIS